MDRSAAGVRTARSDGLRNKERLVAAAVSAVHREGAKVPMATIAADAGVGVGTLYRHFATRQDLVEEMTFRAVSLMLSRIKAATEAPATAAEGLRAFLTAVIGDRHDMVLGSTQGPWAPSERSRAAQDELHRRIRELIERGRHDGTIRRAIDVWDVAWLGATLAQPDRPGPAWEKIAGRLLDTYIAGLGVE